MMVYRLSNAHTHICVPVYGDILQQQSGYFHSLMSGLGVKIKNR